MKSAGGGANAILVRGQIVSDRAEQLRVRPERRVAQLVRLGSGETVANFHASTRVPLAEAELERLWRLALAFSSGAPVVLGGDLNLRAPATPAGEIAHVAARDVDHLFARGLRPIAAAERLDSSLGRDGGRVTLSDHPPLAVELAPVGGD
jgi:endonuclease/exonuclease/phosphatase (EEP) superfamily protein YafD